MLGVWKNTKLPGGFNPLKDMSHFVSFPQGLKITKRFKTFVGTRLTLGIPIPERQRMIGVYNHLPKRKVFRFHDHSQKVSQDP